MTKFKFSSNPLIVIVLVFVLVAAVYVIIQNKKGTYKKDVGKRPEISGKCKYGAVPKDEFLEKYTVKKGDTLLSIAKSELNDSSRFNELIQLNKDRFPQLSLEKPFLEIGWTIYLPPRDIITSGVLGKGHNEILEIHETYWFVSYGNAGENLNLVSTTKFEGKARDEYKVHDCITSLSDWGKAISVSPQD